MFEDTKGGIQKLSMKEQTTTMAKRKRTNNDLQSTTQKTKLLFSQNIQHTNVLSIFGECALHWVRVIVNMFNTTFNNISVISWPSVLVVEENVVP
jgi:hypothetical protein